MQFLSQYTAFRSLGGVASLFVLPYKAVLVLNQCSEEGLWLWHWEDVCGIS